MTCRVVHRSARHREICSRILKSGDGTYTRVIIGEERRFHWTNITPGKDF